MIRPDGFRGAAFGTIAEGDARTNDDLRLLMSQSLGVSPEWAFVTQVHGSTVIEARKSGLLGDADAIFTLVTNLPTVVATADCVPIIIEGEDVVAVVHAGWRGALAGVVEKSVSTMRATGTRVLRAAIGPAIGPCCYEVGAEVAERFSGYVDQTTWGSPSIDLPLFVEDRLDGLEVWRAGTCTFSATDLYSYRRDKTKNRQVAVGWLPSD